MGKRGPRPTPKEVLKARDSWRAELNRNEPVPMAGAPDCPAWLGEAQKEIWKQVCEQVAGMRLLSRADQNTLARYCDMFVRWKKAAQFIAERGETYVIKDRDDKIKGIYAFPQVKIYQLLAGSLLRIEQEYGLTPSARSRIQLPAAPESAKPEDSKSAKFFGGPRLATG